MKNSPLLKETRTIQLLIVEDFPLVRDGFCEILKKEEGLEIVGAAGSAEEALEILEVTPVDVILMDIRLPGMDGDEATSIVKKRWPKVKVIALTTYGDRGFIKKLVREGASGYLLKDADRSELVKGIFAVFKGDTYYSSSVTKFFVEGDPWRDPGKKDSRFSYKIAPEDLTRRERDVLRLICQEMTNREIADQLCISTRTVDSHRRNLLMKIDARNTAGLVIYALKHGLDQEELF